MDETGEAFNYQKIQDIKHGTLYKNMDKYPSTAINAKAALTTVLKHRLFYVSLAPFLPYLSFWKIIGSNFFLVNSSGAV